MNSKVRSKPGRTPERTAAPLRVLIAPDKFKGTLTAKQAAQAIARGWRQARPDDLLDLLPMSDGGDGFGTVLSHWLGADSRRVNTMDAAHRPCRAHWWWEPHTRTAIVESARVIGLAMLPPRRFHPFDLDTAGLARVLTAVSKLNPRRCIIGIGGSATNDAGFGLARALGWRFLDRQGNEIFSWPDLVSCHQIIPPARRPGLGQLVVAVDVKNPLLGPKGCTRVYGPQKGFRPADFKRAEQALARMAQVMKRESCKSADSTAGAGAAGGLGYGLMTFLKAKPMAGFTVFAREAGLTRRLQSADLAITGEGRLDHQSLMGKGVGELLAECERHGVPCIGIAGLDALPRPARTRFAALHALTALTSAKAAMRHPRFHLERIARQAAATWNHPAPWSGLSHC